MNLTRLIRNLESQLKSAEKMARQYDSQAAQLKTKLSTIAKVVGQKVDAIRASAQKSSVGRGFLSAEGRAKIIAAQRKRWADFNKGKPAKAKSSPKAKKGRGKLSSEGRAKIIAAQRKRWAAFRKSKS